MRPGYTETRRYRFALRLASATVFRLPPSAFTRWVTKRIIFRIAGI